MREDDPTYHHRRSTMQRKLAERADNPAIAGLHRELARLHEDCVARPLDRRPRLRIVLPT